MNDPVEWTMKLRQALMAAITPDDMREIGLQIVAQAKRGDPQALRTLLALVQPPPQATPRIGPINVQTGGNGRRQPKAIPHLPDAES